jgi:hypothetical protein
MSDDLFGGILGVFWGILGYFGMVLIGCNLGGMVLSCVVWCDGVLAGLQRVRCECLV